MNTHTEFPGCYGLHVIMNDKSNTAENVFLSKYIYNMHRNDTEHLNAYATYYNEMFTKVQDKDSFEEVMEHPNDELMKLQLNGTTYSFVMRWHFLVASFDPLLILYFPGFVVFQPPFAQGDQHVKGANSNNNNNNNNNNENEKESDDSETSLVWQWDQFLEHLSKQQKMDEKKLNSKCQAEYSLHSLFRHHPYATRVEFHSIDYVMDKSGAIKIRSIDRNTNLNWIPWHCFDKEHIQMTERPLCVTVKTMTQDMGAIIIDIALKRHFMTIMEDIQPLHWQILLFEDSLIKKILLKDMLVTKTNKKNAKKIGTTKQVLFCKKTDIFIINGMLFTNNFLNLFSE
ncbi:hypothetical protein RFI_32068 [Reticulomyxa filosa]|uniref:Uncharacterized protein n=1 Tax=Reticulomyxa filosa TaxID=46433 RepID=X6LUM9_RETFI|nr:hypothetical protein RFI_32068 [Reticulomyxa filosa]|eukprot:ETO05329.1 hypothetical protein RFI_32068 [Reticulomyxa filosa]